MFIVTYSNPSLVFLNTPTEMKKKSKKTTLIELKVLNSLQWGSHFTQVMV